MTRTAKLFRNGRSQAVRLPAEFRFAGSEVYATRDDITGEVVLSDRPGANVWRTFFKLMRSIAVPAMPRAPAGGEPKFGLEGRFLAQNSRQHPRS